jgi:L-amino acid N-acyltransferase YncA
MISYCFSPLFHQEIHRLKKPFVTVMASVQSSTLVAGPFLTVREAEECDIESVTAIYAHYVRTSTATFETEPPSTAEMTARWRAVKANGLPFLVATAVDTRTDGGSSSQPIVVGYAYVQWFKPRVAYQFTLETSIYIRPGWAKGGVGKRLMTDLLDRSARECGARTFVAVIGDSANIGSIKLHKGLGFHIIGTIHEAGWKFDRWIDVVMMERRAPAEVRALPPRRTVRALTSKL